MPRIYCATALASGDLIDLPGGAARHVQVLRLQPGDPMTLFDGRGGEFSASIVHMGRSEVRVLIGLHLALEREPARAVHLALGMPANERMDWLIEKATELGVASIQPLITERSVLRLGGERADKKVAHWQAIAIAACEQSGRNRVPLLHPVLDWARWLGALEPERSTDPSSPTVTSAQADPPAAVGPGPSPQRLLLSLATDAQPLVRALRLTHPVLLLSGPEGGLTPREEAAARDHGFETASLGPRTLRSETAPLAALAVLTVAE